MATLVLSAVGASIGGSLATGFLGTALGVAGGFAGGLLGGSIDRALGIAPSRRVEGPRLGDLSVQSSAYGQTVPLVYGTMRVAGNVIWSTGIRETRQEETQSAGGKGGGGSVTQVTYTYSVSCAVAVAGCPIDSIGRVWADGKLLRGASGSLAVGGTMRVHTGAEAQDPDPLIEAMEGMGNAPAYRGLAYVVFEDLQLAEYANRIPNLTFEVIGDAGGTVSLSTVVSDLAARAGLQHVDASALISNVSGFALGRSASFRQAIEALSQAYPLDGREVDGLVTFAPLPRAIADSVTEAGIVAEGRDGDRRTIETVRVQDQELPREIIIRHMDPARDYQVGAQRARRQVTQAHRVDEVDLALVMNADAAKQVAEVVLARAWMARDRVTFTLPARYLRVASGDVMRIEPQNGPPFEVQIEEVEFGGGRITCSGVKFRADVFASAASGDSGLFPPSVIPAVPDTALRLLNLPPVTTTDLTTPAFYAAAASAGDNWRGGVLYRSTDGGLDYAAAANLTAYGVIGTALDILGPGPTDYWDEGGTLTVTFLHPDMTLESRPHLAVLNGANAALVGEEIIQFRNATLNPDGSYTLAGLLRGRRGTDHAIPGHGSDEDFVLLSPAGLVPVEAGLSALGKDYLYKGVSVGQLIGDVSAEAFTYAGLNFKPFCPVHLKGVRAVGGDLTITWVRRTRAAGDWLDGADVPLGEEQERYEVDILDSGTVVRTIEATSPAVTYSAADQISDFGATQASVTVAVHQISATIGRGHGAAADL
jgi:hypothetical protein